jgi:hypothetical protein
VIGIERDRLRLEMARHNVAVYGHARRFQPLQADLAELPPLAVSAFFFDPARRDEQGRRLYSVAGYRPPLSLLNRWRQRVPHGAAKVSPGVDYGKLPDRTPKSSLSRSTATCARRCSGMALCAARRGGAPRCCPPGVDHH